MKNFLRKHAKIIMGIVSIALMFVFAMPGFRTPNAKENDTRVIGTIGGRKIIQDDLTRALGELGQIENLQLYNTIGSTAWYFVQTEPAEEKRALYWLLLKEESRKYQASLFAEADAAKFISERGLDSRNLSPRLMASILSDLDTVENYVEFLMQQPRPISSLELRADKQLRKLQVWYLTLDAGQDWQQIPDPSEAQILAQFNAYKGVVHTLVPALDASAPLPAADKDGRHFPFGYKYPDQVAVEYVVLDRAAVEALVTARDDAAQKLKDKTLAFEDEFSKNPEKYKDKKWDDVKDSLIKAQVDKRVSRRMKLMTDAFVERAAKAAATGPVDYQKLAKDIAKASEFMGYEPQVKSTPLMGAEDLAKVEGIGGASTFVQARNADYLFAGLAVSVSELVKTNERDPIGMMKLKVGGEGPPLTDAKLNNYIYRVTKAVPTHEAASVDEGEIRKQVIEDFKKLENYKKNVQRMKSLAKSAGSGDLEALATQEKLSVSKPAEFTQLTPVEFRNLSNPDLVQRFGKEMVDAEKTKIGFDQLKEIMAIRGSVDAAFALANLPGASDKRSGELESDSTLRCYVLQIQKVTPASGAEFAAKRLNLFFEQQEDVMTFMRAYLQPSALEARLKWVPKP